MFQNIKYIIFCNSVQTEYIKYIIKLNILIIYSNKKNIILGIIQ